MEGIEQKVPGAGGTGGKVGKGDDKNAHTKISYPDLDDCFQ